MTRFSTICLLSSLIMVGAAAQPPQHTKDALGDIKKKVEDKKAVLLDCREKPEWDGGHLRDARFLPLSDITGTEKKADFDKGLPKDQPIYIHCASGVRCVKAAAELQKRGYDARPIKEGVAALVKAGFVAAK